MKKIFISVLASFMMISPAIADNGGTWNYNYNYNYKYDNGVDNEGLYIAGGILGGLLLGRALAQPEPVYVVPQRPREVCGTRWTREWNAVYGEWERVPHTVCYWE